MKVEFNTVHSDSKEMYEKGNRSDQLGNSSVPYYNQEDTIHKIVIDLSRIVGFKQSYIYFNENRKEMVQVETKREWSQNLLIPYNEFLLIYNNYLKEEAEYEGFIVQVAIQHSEDLIGQLNATKGQAL